MSRWTDLDTRDYARLLKLSGDYRISELQVDEDDWLAGKDLNACNLREEGIMVLGIERTDGSYVGAPHGGTPIHPGDTLLLYGRRQALHDLDTRPAGTTGEQQHADAVDAQSREVRRQERREAEHERKREREERDRKGAGDAEEEE